MNKTSKVYSSPRYKKGKKYESYRVQIPKNIADDFGLDNKQELLFSVDKLNRSITFYVIPEDKIDYESWTERIMKEDGRRIKKTGKTKIYSDLLTRKRKWIYMLKDEIKKNEIKIKEVENIISNPIEDSQIKKFIEFLENQKEFYLKRINDLKEIILNHKKDIKNIEIKNSSSS